MGNPSGFMEIQRELPPRRPVEERLKDWREIYLPFPDARVQAQGARCMDCGVPFCHQGCPLGNLIPDWNDLVYRDRWREAIDSLHFTNNFPEFTGRLCPAPCENSCVLGINEPAVTIKQIEVSIIDRAFEEGWVRPEPPRRRTGKKVAVVGSGPAGLACAQQLNKAGHLVTVLERDDRIGGLLRYGIPEFKMEKSVLDRRLRLMEEEGVQFITSAGVGVTLPVEDLRKEHDALVLCCGATHGRDLPVPGRELKGIHMAMEFLPMQNRRCQGDSIAEEQFITGKDKRVVILGGGDTGADCLGTVHRQGARSVHQFEILPLPPRERAATNPWPEWANVLRTSGAHEEGGIRDYAISTKRFAGRDGAVERLEAIRVEWASESGRMVMKEIPGSEMEIACDLVLLAMGFLGPEKPGPINQLGLKLTERGNVWADENKMTSVPGVFTAGDMRRGQSLIVWAIAEGRQAARGVDLFLMGSTQLA
ncbi:MAG TPA: glutamate synthase subunit beta [Planctomycetota bacterium]|nr:glutamate synthase subunit beta [Planctomycetota bacterium]